jgi:hypothetical protein
MDIQTAAMIGINRVLAQSLQHASAELESCSNPWAASRHHHQKNANTISRLVPQAVIANISWPQLSLHGARYL